MNVFDILKYMHTIPAFVNDWVAFVTCFCTGHVELNQ